MYQIITSGMHKELLNQLPSGQIELKELRQLPQGFTLEQYKQSKIYSYTIWHDAFNLVAYVKYFPKLRNK